MVKKINKDAITIKELLKKGMKQFQIAKLLNLKRAKVNYWSKVEIKDRQFKKKKLNDQYIKAIQKWANNKTTSFRSSRKISVMINNVLEKKEKRTRMEKSFQFILLLLIIISKNILEDQKNKKGILFFK